MNRMDIAFLLLANGAIIDMKTASILNDYSNIFSIISSQNFYGLLNSKMIYGLNKRDTLAYILIENGLI